MRKIILGLLLAGGSTAGVAQTFNTLGSGNTLVSATVATPGTTIATTAVTGLQAGDTLVGIDYRPAAPRVLYSLSNSGRLYAVNATTGAATQIGTPSAFVPNGQTGFDFNPSVDRIRVVTSTGQDVRLNQTVGAGTSTLAATDGTLAYADGTAAIPTVAGAAYTNNVAGGTPTTLYVIDTRGVGGNAFLATQGSVNSAPVSPNTGQLFTVGSLGVGSAGPVGFDIATTGGTNTAYATLTDAAGDTKLYSVNLATGTATLIGSLAGTNVAYNGLALSLAPFSTMGVTANQQAVGRVLDRFTGLPGANVNALFAGIDATPAADQAAALQQLTPAAYSLLPEISLNGVEAQETNVLRYLRDLRGTAEMPDGTTATLDDAGRFGSFIVGGGRFGSYDADIDRPSIRNDEFHVIGGLDYRFSPKSLIGVMGGYSKSDVNFGASAGSNLESGFGGAYGTVGVGPVYIDAWGSYNDLKWDLARTTQFGGFTGFNTASTSGRVWAAGGSTGLSFSFGNFEIEPFAALRYADVKIDGFTETGSVTALNVSGVNEESLRLNLGGRIGTKFDVAGAVVRPQLRGGWYREFMMDDSRLINASFVNGQISTPFGFATTPLSNEYYNVGAALNIAGNGPISLVADYDVQFDDDRQFHAFTIGARAKF